MAALLIKMGVLGYPLLVLSILALAMIVQQTIAWLLGARRRAALLASFSALLHANHSQPKAVRDELVSETLALHVARLHSGTRSLRLIAVISPMVGLLGTVVGMIQAFQKIAGSEQAVNPAMLADGLWVAMLTTAYGLCIALPALLAAHFFSRLADGVTARWVQALNQQSLKIEGVKWP